MIKWNCFWNSKFYIFFWVCRWVYGDELNKPLRSGSDTFCIYNEIKKEIISYPLLHHYQAFRHQRIGIIIIDSWNLVKKILRPWNLVKKNKKKNGSFQQLIYLLFSKLKMHQMPPFCKNCLGGHAPDSPKMGFASSALLCLRHSRPNVGILRLKLNYLEMKTSLPICKLLNCSRFMHWPSISAQTIKSSLSVYYKQDFQLIILFIMKWQIWSWWWHLCSYLASHTELLWQHVRYNIQHGTHRGLSARLQ